MPVPAYKPKKGADKAEKPVTNHVGLNARVQKEIRSVVKLSTFKPVTRLYLDTGYPQLNAALGSRTKGIPYGKIIEIRGKNHGGKTLISQLLAGKAQADGAGVGLIDVEQSRDRDWIERFNVNYEDMVRIYPKLIARKNKPPRLETAEELFAEAEAGMAAMAAAGIDRQLWYVDSIAMLRTGLAILGTKKQQKKNIAPDRNMRSALDRAMFLSEKLPDWVGLAAAYNAIIILVNQVRVKPGVLYGNPEYSPGGMAMEHACSIRSDVARVSHGRIRSTSGKVCGILTKVSNFKNKAGGKSNQGDTCVVKIRWDKTPVRVTVYDEEEGVKEL